MHPLTLLVRNTFLDCGCTAGGLLSEGERVALLCCRGGRRAATCFAALAAASDGESEEVRELESPAASRASTDRGSEDSPGSPALRQMSTATDEEVQSSALSPPWSPLALRRPEWLGDAASRRERSASPCSTADTLAAAPAAPCSPAEADRPAEEEDPAAGGADAPQPRDSPGGADLEGAPRQRRQRSGVLRADIPAWAAAGLPNIGSAGHHLRDCKPCAFLDSRKGCLSGPECTYCHLCGPGEKKRRQKERRKLFNTLRRAQPSTVVVIGI